MCIIFSVKVCKKIFILIWLVSLNGNYCSDGLNNLCQISFRYIVKSKSVPYKYLSLIDQFVMLCAILVRKEQIVTRSFIYICTLWYLRCYVINIVANFTYPAQCKKRMNIHKTHYCTHMYVHSILLRIAIEYCKFDITTQKAIHTVYGPTFRLQYCSTSDVLARFT